MLFSGNIFMIASISNFGLIFAYLMVSLALIHFRRLHASAEFRAPFYPYLQVVCMLGLVALMIGMPQEALVVGILLVLGLIIIYYSLREIENKKVVRVRLFR